MRGDPFDSHWNERKTAFWEGQNRLAEENGEDRLRGESIPRDIDRQGEILVGGVSQVGYAVTRDVGGSHGEGVGTCGLAFQEDALGVVHPIERAGGGGKAAGIEVVAEVGIGVDGEREVQVVLPGRRCDRDGDPG